MSLSKLKVLKNKGTLVVILFFLWGMWSSLTYYSQEHVKHYLLQRLIVIFSISALLLIWEIVVLYRKQNTSDKILDIVLHYRYFICFSFLLLFCILGIHGYSLEMWKYYLAYESPWKLQLWGTENSIQSDVWAIGIPQFLNQIHNGFPIFNYDMMTQGGNVTLSGMPGMGLTFLGQPHYFGALLGPRFGLAWLYWFRKFALLLTSYETLLFVTDEKKDYSIVGAFVITTCPVLTWWFGHTVTVSVIYAFWCVACVVNYLKYRDNMLKKIGCAVLGGMGAIGFVFGWYPALQVPFGYLILILSIAAMIRYKSRNGILFDKKDILIIGITIVAVVLILGQYLCIAKDSIAQLSGTAYPGKRVCVGGEYARTNLGYFAFQHLLKESSVSFGNICEVSNVVPFLPIIYIAVPIVIVRSIKRRTIKKQLLLIALFIYELFLTAWMFLPFPEWFAKITLFSYVAGNRIIWTVGVISVLIGIMCFAELVDYQTCNWKKAVIALMSGGVVTALIYYCTNRYKDELFITMNGTVSLAKQFIIVFMILFVFYSLYMYGKKNIILLALFIMSLYFEMTVSPIEMGLGGLDESELAKEIQEIEKNDPDAMWVADGAFVNANFIYAQGVKVYNTTNEYMDSEKWKMFEEKGADENIYNRYAQLMVSFTGEESSIQLLQNDLILMYLNINDCDELGIDYIMTSAVLENTDWKNQVTLEYVDKTCGQRIYSYNGEKGE